ncbi:hypothetical protein [Dyadobacter fermentans]|uniref:hypothetical protein n=1 Tax=Dyadobacter fermentans TaxID=94254 RepID=UPI001CBFEC60|nr:hypothetical protein [Dyadobacter fermentans]MBZ1362028.1 hypothetical protein [Dyadobacter fermentans]
MAKQQTPKGSEAGKSPAPSPFTVLKPFRDIENWDIEHKPGDDVSHFSEARLASLIERGLVQGEVESEVPGDNLD